MPVPRKKHNGRGSPNTFIAKGGPLTKPVAEKTKPRRFASPPCPETTNESELNSLFATVDQVERERNPKKLLLLSKTEFTYPRFL